jgi:hypothetical protein
MRMQKVNTHLTWSDLEETFDKLERTVIDKDSVNSWLVLWSDLEKRIRSEETSLRRASYANTIDKDMAESYKDYAHNLTPKVESKRSQLREKYLTAVKDGKVKPNTKVVQLFQFK